MCYHRPGYIITKEYQDLRSALHSMGTALKSVIFSDVMRSKTYIQKEQFLVKTVIDLLKDINSGQRTLAF